MPKPPNISKSPLALEMQSFSPLSRIINSQRNLLHAACMCPCTMSSSQVQGRAAAGGGRSRGGPGAPLCHLVTGCSVLFQNAVQILIPPIPINHTQQATPSRPARRHPLCGPCHRVRALRTGGALFFAHLCTDTLCSPSKWQPAACFNNISPTAARRSPPRRHGAGPCRARWREPHSLRLCSVVDAHCQVDRRALVARAVHRWCGHRLPPAPPPRPPPPASPRCPPAPRACFPRQTRAEMAAGSCSAWERQGPAGPGS